MENWEREELISNLGGALASCTQVIQDKMLDMLRQCDAEYGQRVADAIMKAKEMMQQNGKAATGSAAKKEEAVVQAEAMASEARPY